MIFMKIHFLNIVFISKQAFYVKAFYIFNEYVIYCNIVLFIFK